MRKKSVFFLLTLLSAVLFMTACNNSNGDGDSATGQDMVIFTDSVGRQVEVPAQISRVAPSGYFAQMVLFALDPSCLVGLSNLWTGAADGFIDNKYRDYPVLGQIYGSGASINLEELAVVNPQVIIDIGEAKAGITEDMDNLTAQLGIPAVHITASTQTMGEAYRMLGRLLGQEEAAEILADYCEETYAEATALIERVGPENKVDLLYCLGSPVTGVVARGSFHAEVIDLMGNNLAVLPDPSPRGTGNEVDMEQLLNWDPDLILFAPDGIYDTVVDYLGYPCPVGSPLNIEDGVAWRQMTAIQNNAYYEVPMGPYNWLGFPPSVNRYLGLLWLGELLYPDQITYDLYTEVVRYYELFYHCDISEEQFAALTEKALPQ